MMITLLMERIKLHGKKSSYFGTYLEWAKKALNAYCKDIEENEYFKEYLLPCVVGEWEVYYRLIVISRITIVELIYYFFLT